MLRPFNEADEAPPTPPFSLLTIALFVATNDAPAGESEAADDSEAVEGKAGKVMLLPFAGARRGEGFDEPGKERCACTIADDPPAIADRLRAAGRGEAKGGSAEDAPPQPLRAPLRLKRAASCCAAVVTASASDSACRRVSVASCCSMRV